MLSLIKKNIIFAERLFGLLLILSLAIIPSCLGVSTHVRNIEPSAFPLNKAKYKVIEPVEFKVSSFKLFWMFPVTQDLKIHETIEETVNNKGGDNLIDMQVWHERQVWILGTVDIVHIKGTIVRTLD